MIKVFKLKKNPPNFFFPGKNIGMGCHFLLQVSCLLCPYSLEMCAKEFESNVMMPTTSKCFSKKENVLDI